MDSYIQAADTIVSKYFKLYKQQYDNVGVLLSGGIDSTLITSYVNEYFPSAFLFSMGTANTKDRPFIDIASRFFQKNYDWIELIDSEVKDALPIVRSLLKKADVELTVMQQSLAVGYFLIFKRAKSLGIRTIITGQGPDILFAGYHKYKVIPQEKVNAEISSDLPLLEIDKKRDGQMANHFGITLINPYLENEFVQFAFEVPTEYKISRGIEKYLMREWGRYRNLPDAIINRPKKAFQYSTGLQNLVMKIV